MPIRYRHVMQISVPPACTRMLAPDLQLATPYRLVQRKAFHGGTRVNPFMSPMAQGLSDTDIANQNLYLK